MARFEPNLGFERAFARSAGYATLLRGKAEQAADEARRIARVEAYDSGAYHDSIDAAVGMVDGRFKGRVVATDFKAHWIEFGTARSGTAGRARRVLSRAAEAAASTFQRR